MAPILEARSVRPTGEASGEIAGFWPIAATNAVSVSCYVREVAGLRRACPSRKLTVGFAEKRIHAGAWLSANEVAYWDRLAGKFGLQFSKIAKCNRKQFPAGTDQSGWRH